MRRVVRTGWIVTVALASTVAVRAQPTVGLMRNTAPEPGLTLFSPTGSTDSFLIHNDGLLVRSWSGTARPGLMAYLLPSGHLLRTTKFIGGPPPNFPTFGGSGGRLEEYDWDGNLVWEFHYGTADHLAHHDIAPLPDGNVLMIAWDFMSPEDAIAAGKDPAVAANDVLIDSIIEVQPTPPFGGTIVWEWHLRDHLIQDFDPTKDNFGPVADHPELVDFNYGTRRDWSHFNGIDHDPVLDRIVVSVHALDEIWILDHSTTTAEAAGHSGGNAGRGGDILYRWGNPEAYRRGTAADRKLFGPHDAQWIDAGHPGAGNVLVFNNGSDRPEGSFSTVEEIVPPTDASGNSVLEPGLPFGPDAPLWIYQGDPPETFYSGGTSGAFRLAGGNTLVCEGQTGRLFEVEADSSITWEYQNPVTRDGILDQGEIPDNSGVFKTRRYPPDYPGFAGRDLTPGDPIEGFVAPVPVPDGTLRAARSGPAAIDVTWDAAACPSLDYRLLYGALSLVAGRTPTGSVCDLGLSGAYSWTTPPAADLYFLVVGADGTGIYESSWGTDSAGLERNETQASFLCGATTKVVSSTCP